jgi:hypothetical protein
LKDLHFHVKVFLDTQLARAFIFIFPPTGRQARILPIDFFLGFCDPKFHFNACVVSVAVARNS